MEREGDQRRMAKIINPVGSQSVIENVGAGFKRCNMPCEGGASAAVVCRLSGGGVS